MKCLSAINQPSEQCRGRFTVPNADLSACHQPFLGSGKSLDGSDFFAHSQDRDGYDGADKSAMGTINRPLHCPDARLPTTHSYTRIFCADLQLNHIISKDPGYAQVMYYTQLTSPTSSVLRLCIFPHQRLPIFLCPVL